MTHLRWLVISTTGVALLGAPSALADEPAERSNSLQRARQLIANLERPSPPDGDERYPPSVHIRKGRGLEYRRAFRTERKKLFLFAVHGPVLKTTKKKKYGLGFEIRF